MLLALPGPAVPLRVEAVQSQTDQVARQSQLSPERSMCVRQVVSEQVEPVRARPVRVAAALAQADQAARQS